MLTVFYMQEVIYAPMLGNASNQRIRTMEKNEAVSAHSVVHSEAYMDGGAFVAWRLQVEASFAAATDETMSRVANEQGEGERIETQRRRERKDADNVTVTHDRRPSPLPPFDE